MEIKKMRVSRRLATGFGLVLLMMSMIILIALARFSIVADINKHLIENDWVKADAINTIDSLTRSNARNTMELLIASDRAQAATIQTRIETTKKRINEAFATLETLIAESDGQTLLVKIKAARTSYVASFTKVSALFGEGKRDDAIRLMNAETLQTLDALQEPITAMAALQKKTVADSSATLQQQIESGRRLLIVLGALALLIGVAASLLITRTLLLQLGGEPEHAVEIAEKIAAGDLTVVIHSRTGDQTSLMAAMARMRDALVQIVTQVRSGTDTIATASGQIAAGNLDLSSRTEQQASALEETASSMEELTSTVKQNADNARQANQMAGAASAVAMKGGTVVAQVVETMGSINASARKIVDIIAVIDGIAFQTNILALNAAVEAARAGEQGRGFAVVASEVRTLAQRSAAAAKEIKVLISDSVEQVGAGTVLVGQAGATMKEIVDSVGNVTTIMGEITSASHEQTAGIEQINQAIAQMDEVTQQNAALVEEAAAAAASLQDQAGVLVQVVGVFKTGSAVVTPPVSASRTKPVAANVKTIRRAVVASVPRPPVSAQLVTNSADGWETF